MPLLQDKFQQTIQNPNEPVLDYYNHLEVAFKQFLGLEKIDASTYLLFNTMFLSGLDEELRTSVKRHHTIGLQWPLIN